MSLQTLAIQLNGSESYVKIVNCYNDSNPKHFTKESMYTYNQVLNEAKTLTPDEQLRLLEELATLIRQRVISQNQSTSKEIPRQNLNRWYGFLPKRVDALEFQLKLRQEWDD